MNPQYNEAINYLFSQLPMFSRTGGPAYKPGLDTSIQLADFFNNPHEKFKSIHVGGTNGKGSTSHLLASILQCQGYKVGLYTSPHLVDFRERIRINGKMIPEDCVVDFVDSWKNTDYDGHPSFFELTMIMAFDWFAKEEVDYAVIEVGMGGRLDSTNIINPELCVITNISHDHNQFLGETLSQIASEKAGIIKPGIPVVIGERRPETEKVFLNKAAKEKAPIKFAETEIENLDIFPIAEGWKCNWNSLKFELPLGGDYQQKNLKTVLATVKGLRDIGIEISDTSLVKGIENVISQTGFAGRWTILQKKPLVIADTGHNLAGISYNVKQLSELMELHKTGELRIIIGFVADKAIDKILDLLPTKAIYYVTNAQIPRALPGDQLLTKFIERGFSAHNFRDVKSAWLEAKKEASEEDVIFIGGSTFIVADFFAEV